ncbi:MAG: deoxyribodipyrimidine photo-lyase [Betaproteobacteria bacterium]|nr:deoxyribodipyrimidine photo-lyase [Betaproteobacteria bacterium]
MTRSPHPIQQVDAGLMWFRRDLRAFDNAALHHALTQCKQVHCVFVFDSDILDALPKADRRVEFIRESLVALDADLQALCDQKGVGLIVRHGKAAEEIARLAQELRVQEVFANHDYEPPAIERDAKVRGALADAGIGLQTYKDHVIFERSEVLTQMGRPYGVFTPYKNAWLQKLTPAHLESYAIQPLAKALAPRPKHLQLPVPSLEDIGFETTNLKQLAVPTGSAGGQMLFEDFFDRMDKYDEARNFPAVKGPSYLGVHLRFGTVSIRQLFRLALESFSEGSESWLNELIWREFYFQILFHRPDVAFGKAFKKEYELIAFENNPNYFKAWTEGKTGYPIVDAAMRQLNQTGFMHNRLRMIAASFLVKDLLVDWRWGEAYFAEKLIDFDLSANNGGWQWAASTGCDAQPWFRIFNPMTQSLRFDPQGKFIKKYIPELYSLDNDEIHAPWLSQKTQKIDYPKPIVDHASQRIKALALYKSVKS